MTGHPRFGARTAAAPAIIEGIFVTLELLLGDDGVLVLALMPAAVVGSLLFFSGIELVLSAHIQQLGSRDLFVVLLITVLTIASNPDAAFVLGIAVAYGLRRGLLRW